MQVVDIVQAVHAVRDHCGALDAPAAGGHQRQLRLPRDAARLPCSPSCRTARLHALNAQSDLPLHDGIVPETTFVGPGFRRHPRLSYVPCRLSMVPRLFHGPLAPDVVVVHTTTPRNGLVSLGLEVNVLPAAIEAARARGRTRRRPAQPPDAVDLRRRRDLRRRHRPRGRDRRTARRRTWRGRPSDDARLIGSRVAAEIGDGATLQAGIGEVPDATIAGVLERRGLKIWTEMFSDGVLVLEEAGALDRGTPVRTSFVFGSQELYDWVDDNPRVHMLRTETTNSPAEIARQPAMTSINTALQVDLFDQANASRIGRGSTAASAARPTSPSGPATPPAARAFMALRSWHPRADVSTIVPLVDEPVTSFQHSAVVTEQGVAWMWGRDEREQARNLIEHAAHPSVREDLWEEARALGLA